MLPLVLYKYMDSKFAKRMELYGQVQIKPLAYYKNEEFLGSQIGDDAEGTIMNNLHINDLVLNGPSQIPMLHRFIHVEGGGKVQLINTNFTENVIDDKYYVFCSSSKYSKKTMREFKADSCITIHSPYLFFKSITRAIKDEIDTNFGFQMVTCQYRSRINNYTQDFYAINNIPAYAIKDIRYKEQNEIRVVWKPANVKKLKESLLIHCKDIIKYCSFEYF